MTDDELAEYLCIAGNPMKSAVIGALSPAKRATYEAMARVEVEMRLWQDGLGPKPQGVLIDTERSTSRRKAWR